MPSAALYSQVCGVAHSLDAVGGLLKKDKRAKRASFIQSLRAFRRAGKREEVSMGHIIIFSLCTIGQSWVHLELIVVDLVWVRSVCSYFGGQFEHYSPWVILGHFSITLV